jgi:hypothetical protein
MWRSPLLAARIVTSGYASSKDLEPHVFSHTSGSRQ